MLMPGAAAPDFELLDQDGTSRKLSQLVADGPVVLFFYPAAFTPVCTKEACYFRDVGAEFAAAGVQRVGISTDSAEKQGRFTDKLNLDYPVLADEGGAVARAYGVRRGLIGKAKRSTFVITQDMTIAGALASEFNAEVHADQALEIARSLVDPLSLGE